MLSINTNLSSLIAQNSIKTSTDKLNLAIERMTTGYKINHAKDNAANYSIATNMTTKINSYMVAEDNAMMGLDMTTAIFDTLELLDEHASRIRDLCEQASNGTYGEESLKAIQSEIDARMQEIERIKANAEYNGIKLLEGESTAGGVVTGKFLAPVTQLTEDEAIAQGYTIVRTADELQAMKNNLSGKYILMNDIDLAGYDWEPVGNTSNFAGELNGNGYVISNLVLNNPTSVLAQGLFGYLYYDSHQIIQNLGLENVDIVGNEATGGLFGGGDDVEVKNCYVTGKITGNRAVGAFAGYTDAKFVNCYSSTVVIGNNEVGAFVGEGSGSGGCDNCFYNSDSSSLSAFGNNPFTTLPIAKSTSELNALIIFPTVGTGVLDIALQVGINSSVDSQIIMSLETLESLSAIDVSSSTSARDCIKTMDDYILGISNIQTNLGAVQNRLESVLEEITIQRDNLVSSRSTIRDADIAEVSSHYIQQQILQQAAATLMATANQSPAVALQLI